MKSAQYYHLKTFQKTKMCFHKFSEKSSMLTYNLATDLKLKKTYPKIIKKQVCKMSAKSLHIQQQVCKNKKSKSSKKSAKSLHIHKMQQQVCKNKKASLQKSCKKSAYSKMKTSLHIQKRWFKDFFDKSSQNSIQVCIFQYNNISISGNRWVMPKALLH